MSPVAEVLRGGVEGEAEATGSYYDSSTDAVPRVFVTDRRCCMKYSAPVAVQHLV